MTMKLKSRFGPHKYEIFLNFFGATSWSLFYF